MTEPTYLIVNADDFGQSHGINRGVIQAYEQGIVTSASLMVRWPAAHEAAAYGRAHAGLSLGIHFDFGEWTYRDKTWVPVYQVLEEIDPDGVSKEVASQLAAFNHLVGQDPTHMDSHQHMHLREPFRSVLTDTARSLGVPLRSCNPVIRYCADFYGQTGEGAPLSARITVDNLIKILADLPPGTSELACHPGDATNLDTAYKFERIQEIATLCHPMVRTAIQTMKITLCSFKDAVRRAESGIFSPGMAIEPGRVERRPWSPSSRY